MTLLKTTEEKLMDSVVNALANIVDGELTEEHYAIAADAVEAMKPVIASERLKAQILLIDRMEYDPDVDDVMIGNRNYGAHGVHLVEELATLTAQTEDK